MTGYATLLRLTVRNRLALLRPGSMRKENGRLDVGKVVTMVCVVLCAAVMLALVIGLEWLIYRGLAMFRHPELLPMLALLCAMVGMVLMSFFTVLNSLFFSRDSVWMGYLPVRSRTVLCAKLTEIYAGEMLLNAVILLPAFVMYGIHVQGDWLYYVRAVLLTLLSPLLPMAIITLLSTVLARLVSGVKNSAVLSAVLTFGMVLLLYAGEMVLLSGMGEDEDIMWLAQLLVQREAMLQAITGFFPPIYWGVKALQGSLGYLLAFGGVSVGSVALVLLMMGDRYLRLCIRQTEQGGSRKRIRLQDAMWRPQTPVRALVGLEWREIVRSSVNLTQCLAGGIVFPLVIGLMLMGGAFSEDFAMMREEIDGLLAYVSATDLMLIVAAVLGFVTFISPAACTAVSREGARHALNRTLPVPARIMLRAKVLCSLLVDAMVAVITLAVLAFGLRLSWTVLLGGVLLTLLLRYASVTIMLLVDTVHPLLNWTTETQAIKQNLNVMFGMVVCLALLALPVVAVIWLAQYGAGARLAAAVVVLVAEAVLGGVLLHTVGERRYGALEP